MPKNRPTPKRPKTTAQKANRQKALAAVAGSEKSLHKKHLPSLTPKQISTFWYSFSKKVRLAYLFLLCVFSGMLIFYVQPSSSKVFNVVFGAFSGLVFFLMLLLYKKIARALGRYTAVAALSVLWAALLGASSLLAPLCTDPITGNSVTCSSDGVGTYLLAGLLFPISLAVLLFPFMFTLRLGLFILKRFYNFVQKGISLPRFKTKASK